MINFCLNEKEKSILKNLVGKQLIKYRHDPLDKFGEETVYGRVELFFKDSVILINYDYEPYHLFGSVDDDRPKFSVKVISENEAVSLLQDTDQININCGEVIQNITLVEDYAAVEWDDKKDDVRALKAIIFKFDQKEMAIQGDYMIPLLDILKGSNLKERLLPSGDEFDDDPETNFKAERFFVELNREL